MCESDCGSNTLCTEYLYAASREFSCLCQPGFSSITNDGHDCGYDNCNTENGGCDQICVYTGDGKNNCACNNGYTQSQKSCSPINNCATINGGCNQNCLYTGAGTNLCSCDSQKYTLSPDGYGCTAINNCALNNGGCSQICYYDSPAESHCACNNGYVLSTDGKSCSAINNCESNNGGCAQNCEYKGPGTSDCSCNFGFVITGLTSCLVINNCQTNNGGCIQTCNFLGPSMNNCSCNFGYKLNSDSVTCRAVNLCAISNGGCDQVCNYTGPSIRACSCNSGYSISSHNLSACDYISAAASSATIGGVTGGVLLTILVLILFVAILRRRQINSHSNPPFDFQMMIVKVAAGLKLNSASIIPTEFKRSNIDVISILGRGNFGEVYKGVISYSISGKSKYLAKMIVAIKSLRLSGNSDALLNREMLLGEAALMAQFDHENVVKLVGVVTTGEPLYIILEFCENGAMDSYIKKNIIEYHEKIRFASECSKGMAYLSSLGFVHRDLASRNVLLTIGLTCKIADFGLSRAVVDKEYYRSTGGLIAVRWAAPEVLEEQKFSEQSDVWSFGVLLWEIWSQGDMPYKGMSNEKVWAKVTDGYRLDCPENCPADLYTLMVSSWALEGSRPTFSDIYQNLSLFLNKFEDIYPMTSVQHSDESGLFIGPANGWFY